MNFHRKSAELDPQVAAYQTAITAVVAGFRDAIDRNTGETAALRSEMATLRTQFAERETRIVRDAMSLMGDSARQLGLVQQQLAAVNAPDALIQLAAEAAERGLLEHLNQTEAAYARND
jgi:hypothetical protein